MYQTAEGYWEHYMVVEGVSKKIKRKTIEEVNKRVAELEKTNERYYQKIENKKRKNEIMSNLTLDDCIKGTCTLYELYFPNGMAYIGVTSDNPLRRWKSGHGYSQNIEMFDAIVKFGWNNVKKIIVKVGLSEKEASELERQYIKKLCLQDKNYGYNIDEGGFRKTYATKQVVCVTDGLFFNSIKEASEYYGIKANVIGDNCRGKTTMAKGRLFAFYNNAE